MLLTKKWRVFHSQNRYPLLRNTRCVAFGLNIASKNLLAITRRARTEHDRSGTMTVPIALTIAGSDSSGGAGIQADLKTFAALCVYGASVITALTAQNTHGVTGIHQVPADFVTAQLDAVFGDLDVKPVKIRMVAPPSTIPAIAPGPTPDSPKPIRPHSGAV